MIGIKQRVAVLCTLATLASPAYSAEQAQVSQLTDGIFAFQCYHKSESFQIILLENGGELVEVNAEPSLRVTRHSEKVFMFKDEGTDSFLGMLIEDDQGNWVLEQLSENGRWGASCVKIDKLLSDISKAIASKILVNGKDLETKIQSLEQELTTSNSYKVEASQLQEKVDGQKKIIGQLTEKLKQADLKYSKLTIDIAKLDSDDSARDFIKKLGAYNPPYNYSPVISKISELMFDFRKPGVDLCLNKFDKAPLQLSDFCIRSLKNALKPNN